MSDFHLDVDAYLRRIGLSGPIEPTLDNLRLLTRAHLTHIPFENLEILAGLGPVSLEPQDLFDKVVTRRRGGYCFELNKLFFLLLQALHYQVTPACARIVYRRSDQRPWSHRVSIVCLDGVRWLCDVGYGGPGPKDILCLDTPGPQDAAGERFFANPEPGFITLLRQDPDGAHPLIIIRDEECYEIDFDVMNGYFSAHPQAIFTKKTIVYLCTPGGQISLVGDTFTRWQQDAAPEQRILTCPEECRHILREEFGLPEAEV